MKKKNSRNSKLNVSLTFLLVVFVSLLAFSVGVISGKGLSDREHALDTIEGNTKYAKKVLEDDDSQTPLGEDMTEREVELLTAKALEEARKNPMGETDESQEIIAEIEQLDKMEQMALEDSEDFADEDRDVASNESADREPKSVRPVTTPKPEKIEYTVQVASYQTEKEAEDHSKRLIDKGFPAFPVKAVINDTVWYRVSVGSFKTRKQAVKYQRDLKKQALVKSSFVQKVKRQ